MKNTNTKTKKSPAVKFTEKNCTGLNDKKLRAVKHLVKNTDINITNLKGYKNQNSLKSEVSEVAGTMIGENLVGDNFYGKFKLSRIIGETGYIYRDEEEEAIKKKVAKYNNKGKSKAFNLMGEDEAHHRCILTIKQAILKKECESYYSDSRCFFENVNEGKIVRDNQLNEVRPKDSLSKVVLQAIFGDDYSYNEYSFGDQAYDQLLANDEFMRLAVAEMTKASTIKYGYKNEVQIKWSYVAKKGTKSPYSRYELLEKDTVCTATYTISFGWHTIATRDDYKMAMYKDLYPNSGDTRSFKYNYFHKDTMDILKEFCSGSNGCKITDAIQYQYDSDVDIYRTNRKILWENAKVSEILEECGKAFDDCDLSGDIASFPKEFNEDSRNPLRNTKKFKHNGARWMGVDFYDFTIDELKVAFIEDNFGKSFSYRLELGSTHTGFQVEVIRGRAGGYGNLDTASSEQGFYYSYKSPCLANSWNSQDVAKTTTLLKKIKPGITRRLDDDSNRLHRDNSQNIQAHNESVISKFIEGLFQDRNLKNLAKYDFQGVRLTEAHRSNDESRIHHTIKFTTDAGVNIKCVVRFSGDYGVRVTEAKLDKNSFNFDVTLSDSYDTVGGDAVAFDDIDDCIEYAVARRELNSQLNQLCYPGTQGDWKERLDQVKAMSEVVVPGIEKINNKMTKIMEGDNK